MSDAGTTTSTKPMRLAVLMTCFNRRALTLASLGSLFAQEPAEDVEMTVFLVDDGSRDGTAEAVRAEFPQVRLLSGDGSLFWNGGMRKAFAAARDEGFDAYLWFNDDTHLVPEALRRLVACARLTRAAYGAAIIVGSVADPATGERSYGGFGRVGRGLRLDFPPVSPDAAQPVPCATMNGNFTLIPAEVVAQLGLMDGAFRHQLGDVDYGLRATAAGIPVVIAPGYFGTCADNSRDGTWRDTKLPFQKRWRNLMSPKGAPPKEWFLYTRRHFGWRWPLYFVSPYFKTLLRWKKADPPLLEG